MRISWLILLIFLLLRPCVGNGAQSFYSVTLSKHSSMDALLARAAALPDTADLWIHREGGNLELRAGIFPEQQYATLLLEQLAQKLPSDQRWQAEVVPSIQPTPGLWLSGKRSVTFHDLGILLPPNLQGGHPYFSCSYPWPSSTSVTESTLQLVLRSSPVLRQDSTLTILAEKIPLLSIRAADLPSRLSVPLTALSAVDIGDTLDIEITGSLRASDDYCSDMRNTGLWVSIDLESALHLPKLPPQSIGQFFRLSSRRFTLLPRNEDKENIEAMGRVAALIGSLAQDDHSRLAFDQMAVSGGNICIGPFDTDIQLLGSNLYLTPQGAAILASKWFPSLVFSRLQLAHHEIEPAPIRKDITFQELGFRSSTKRGRGDLVFPLRFSPAQLNGWPQQDMLCTLHYSQTPIASREEALLKIHLNGALIDSRDIIADGGQQHMLFTLPARFLQAENTIEFIFSSFQQSGDCLGSSPDLTISVMDDSFMDLTDPHPRPPLTLASFPGVFHGRGALVASELTPASYRPLLFMVEALAFRQKGVPDIHLLTPEQVESSGSNFAIMNLKPEHTQTLKPPLDLTQQRIEVRNPLNSSLLLALESDEKVAVAQTFFTPTGLPVFLYQSRQTEKSTQEALREMLASNSQANVGLIHEDLAWSVMNVGEKFRIIYPNQRSLMHYWIQYRLFFFIVFGALALIFFFYLYHNLAKEK